MRRASAGAQSKQVNASTRRQHVSVECYLITAYDHRDLTSYIREAHWFWRKIAGSLAFGTTPLREHPSMADNTRSQGQGNQGNQGMPGGQQQHGNQGGSGQQDRDRDKTQGQEGSRGGQTGQGNRGGQGNQDRGNQGQGNQGGGQNR
jgi:hypothetical protein